MGSTLIEWATDTWNPTIGCSWTSPGCDRCYAARLAAGRLKHTTMYEGLAVKPGEHTTEAEFTGDVRYMPDRLHDPLRWRKPRMIFVDSMSDLFHPEALNLVTDEGRPALAEILAVMVRADWHAFQVLTKRPQLMRSVLGHPHFRLDVNSMLIRDGHEVMPGGMTDPRFRWPAHLWFGTSIEQDKFTFRADHLRETSAAVRFLSLEPLLEPLPSLDLRGIDWVIVGGESGPHARPMHPDWVRDIRNRCAVLDVPFFFKQAGNVLARQWGMTDRAGHALDEMPEEFRFREWPKVVA
jgi:protein gp37